MKELYDDNKRLRDCVSDKRGRCSCTCRERGYQDTDPEEEKTKRLSVGTLTVLEDDRSSPRANVLNLAVVVEDTIILEELSDLPTGFAYLFGLIYASNIQYPKGLRGWVCLYERAPPDQTPSFAVEEREDR
ncbi:hypothetical protein FQA47_020023 [Oryzias melastigma]|uniref:Uncharacterized protein n=1 Tax=Oryzias melastigma TaxID=30732 RepID=A0A834CNN9_ORYME|nr:hypothetical protein FQA47_020023 [Oryzias melastigma]